jgi:hypothetical protein
MLLLANTCITLFSLPFMWRYIQEDILKIFGLFIFVAITELWLIALIMLLYLAIFYNTRLASFNSIWSLICKFTYAIASCFLLIEILGQLTSLKDNLGHYILIYVPTSIILVIVYEKYLKVKAT